VQNRNKQCGQGCSTAQQQHEARWETGRKQQELGCSMMEDQPGAKGGPSTGGGSPPLQRHGPTASE